MFRQTRLPVATHGGFTLIEVMVVVVILGILLVLAIVGIE